MSRRKVENLRYRQLGFTNWSEYQSLVDSKRYRSIQRVAGQLQGIDDREIRGAGSDFTQGMLRGKRDRWRGGTRSPYSRTLKRYGLAPKKSTQAEYEDRDSP